MSGNTSPSNPPGNVAPSGSNNPVEGLAALPLLHPLHLLVPLLLLCLLGA